MPRSPGVTDPSRSAGPPSTAASGSGIDGALLVRVRLFLRTIFFVHLTLVVMGTGFLVFKKATGPDEPMDVGGHVLAYAMGFVVAGLWWMSARYRWRSFSSQLIAGAGTLVLGIGYPLLILNNGKNFQVDVLFTLMIVSAVLVLRASLVPSPTLATAILGTIAVASPIYRVFHSSDLETFIWYSLMAAIFVAITTVTSQVVYGMEVRVQAATKLGQYELEQPIGSGAMGDVYLARHALLRRQTAVKLLRDVTSSEARAVFRREVQTASLLTHPNTVEIFDYGRTPDGVFFFAMEYVEGATLQRIVETTGPMTPERAVALLHQAAGSLGEAHHRGLVHRDVKPSNLMVCERGGRYDTIKVTDFGLVHDLSEVDPESRLNGTPLYMAPETIIDGTQVLPQNDVYALGATAFFLVAGRPPFESDDLVELLSDHMATPPPPLVCNDVALARVIARCLEKQPNDRYATASELERALEECPSYGKWSNRSAEIWWAEHREVTSVEPEESELQVVARLA